MKRIILACLIFLVAAWPLSAQAQRRTSYCLSLFGSLISFPPRTYVVTPPVQTDPQILASLAILQQQTAQLQQQQALNQQALQMWQQQQAQLQVMQAQHAQLLHAIEGDRINTQETKDLMQQLILSHAAILNALNQPPVVISPTPPAPMPPLPAAPTTPAPASIEVTPQLTPNAGRYKIYSTAPQRASWPWRR